PEPTRDAPLQAAGSAASNDAGAPATKRPARPADPGAPAAEPRAQDDSARQAPGRRAQAVEAAERRGAPTPAPENPGRELARPPERRSRKRRAPRPGDEA